MVGDYAVGAQAARHQQFTDIHVDTDERPTDLTVEVDLRVGGSLGTAGELVGHRHDLAQPHTGLIAI